MCQRTSATQDPEDFRITPDLGQFSTWNVCILTLTFYLWIVVDSLTKEFSQRLSLSVEHKIIPLGNEFWQINKKKCNRNTTSFGFTKSNAK